MEDFALDAKGDIIIENNDIKLISGKELIAQKVRQILKTNLGEWWLNENEGIDFQAIFCKNPDNAIIEDNIKSGLMQVDSTFELTSFDCQYENRKLTINFTAVNENGEKIEMTI